MAYQRRKRRFDRKKVVLVERTICVLVLAAILVLTGRWIFEKFQKEEPKKDNRYRHRIQKKKPNRHKVKRHPFRIMTLYAVTAHYLRSFRPSFWSVPRKTKGYRRFWQIPAVIR